MNTIIFPGFSQKNKIWADEMAIGLTATVINWTHWQTGNAGTDWIDEEIQRAIVLIGNSQINILAKSIGTAVAMGVIKHNPNLVNNVILCGIPTNDFNPGDEAYYEPLKSFPVDKVLCIQNENDNHGSFDKAQIFLQGLNPSIKVLSKHRSDHEYPYLQDFINFFSI